MKTSNASRPVAIWLLIGVGMLIIQIILGGITRLTGSGLSITQWDVITGALPPMNAIEWAEEFDKYKQTPQFRLLNSDFTLSDFKFIWFWEWLHRNWARLMSLVFAIPFIYFLVKGYFRRSMIRPLVVLFLLGALQGAVGWIMVASGLTGDAVYVKPTRLALHFIFAMLLLAYTFWFALKLLVRDETLIDAPVLKKGAWWCIGLLGLQFIFGALMAGHRAAPAAPTWPLINDSFIPVAAFRNGMKDLVEDPITIHLVHRSLAYILFVAVLVWSYYAFRRSASRLFRHVRPWPLVLVIVQVILGIATVLTSIHIRPTKWNDFEWMAQLHQLFALFLLLALVFAAYMLRKKTFR